MRGNIRENLPVDVNACYLILLSNLKGDKQQARDNTQIRSNL
jgi:hypothetical protein